MTDASVVKINTRRIASLLLRNRSSLTANHNLLHGYRELYRARTARRRWKRKVPAECRAFQ